MFFAGRASRAFASLVALGALFLASTPAPSAGAATAPAAVGVTRTTVTVGGLVGTEPASVGAEIGAQARFARANRRGGVAGRTVEYAGNAADTAAAAATVFAIVPAVSDTLDTATLAQAATPFVGSASTTAWDGNRFGFGFVGAQAALQTKVVDGADVPVADLISLKFYQVTKYLTLTRHVPILDAFMVSSKFMAKLPPADADLVREAGRAASDHQAKVDADEEAATIADLKSKGIEIIESIDRKPFIEAVAPVYDTAIKRFGDSKLIDLAKRAN